MIISIDIGTSYSSAFWLTPDGKAQAVDIGTGTSMFGSKFSLPSAVFAGENGELLVGQAAMNSRKRNPQNFCMEFKRNLGENFPILLGDARYLPEDLYTVLYRHMKDCAERAGGEKIERAYLTFPASFGRAKRDIIQSAARAAGLFDTVLVDEPTAAAMRYRDGGYIKDGQRVLIYDFGGGTFDASLIRYEDGEFRLLAVPAGLERCGGTDIDRIIYQDMLGKIDPDMLEQLQRNPLHRLRLESQLAELAVKAKHHLSAAEVFEEDIPIGFDMIPYRLTREALDGLIAGMVGATIACCQKLLESADLQKGSLSAVLLVGGTSRVPLVWEMVHRFAGEIPVLHAVDLELAVAEGALGFHARKQTEKEERQKPRQEDQRAQQESSEDSAQQQYDRGEEYYYGNGKQQSYEEALKWYRSAAERGHAEAQFSLGLMYRSGQGVKRSYKEAFKWYRLAAEQGHAAAQCNLGVMYKYGQGVRQSDDEALTWYRLAAQQGHASAQCNLGSMYHNGQGVKQSYEEALKWYRLAAEQNNASAQCNLGVMYENGQGVQKSDEEALKWYRLAAQQGNAPAQYNLGLLFENGRAVRQSDTEALKWYELAAKQGGEDAVAACKRLKDKTAPEKKSPKNLERNSEIVKFVERYIREESPFQKGAGDFKENSLYALRRYLKIPPDAHVLLAHDDTIFHSGKNGFAITDLGIYCKDFGEKPVFVNWKEFTSGKLTATTPPTNIYIDKQVISYLTGSEVKEQLLSFFTGLQECLRRQV